MHPVLLFVPEEQGNKDTHRIDGEGWNGMRISDLAEVARLIAAREF